MLIRLFVIVCFVLPLTAGCISSRVTSYYRLKAYVEPTRDNVAVLESPLVGLREVKIPQYLDRQELVTWQGDYELNVHDLHRWSEPLRYNIGAVLREYIENDLGPGTVVVFPYPSGVRPSGQLIVEITEFDATSDGVSFSAVWRKNDEMQGVSFNTYVRIDGQDKSAIVRAMSEALAKFSRELSPQL